MSTYLLYCFMIFVLFSLFYLIFFSVRTCAGSPFPFPSRPSHPFHPILHPGQRAGPGYFCGSSIYLMFGILVLSDFLSVRVYFGYPDLGAKIIRQASHHLSSRSQLFFLAFPLNDFPITILSLWNFPYAPFPQGPLEGKWPPAISVKLPLFFYDLFWSVTRSICSFPFG